MRDNPFCPVRAFGTPVRTTFARRPPPLAQLWSVRSRGAVPPSLHLFQRLPKTSSNFEHLVKNGKDSIKDLQRLFASLCKMLE
jgi:hypothetical protein